MVSSSSSSSSSSPSPFASGGVPPTPRRAMEEVWKDIALSAPTPVLDTSYCHQLGEHAVHRAATSPADASTTLSRFRGAILQDFLAKPFRGISSQGGPTVAAAEDGSQCRDGRWVGSSLPLPPHPSPPATVLSLSSGVDFHYLGGAAATTRSMPVEARSWNHSHNQTVSTTSCHRHPSSSPSVLASPFSASLGSPYRGFIPFCGNRKRNPEQQQLDSSDGSGNDRRHKRMIKNRESAARSRARKQAYTNELETEVNHLTEENQKLRRQHEELRAKIAAQLPARKSLRRSSSAPF